jgi:hypothetical protein
MQLKRLLQKLAWRIIAGRPPTFVEFDNTYHWLNYAYYTMMNDPSGPPREVYAWGALQGAALAKVLNYPRISILEFGVAGGAGLLAMEKIAGQVERLTGLQIDVYGFDSGVGMPAPIDYRDQPNMWFAGQFPMKREYLEHLLQRAKLYIGYVKDTLPAFIAANPAAMAFASFDLDIYSSTRDALELFNTDYEFLLPRVICYFDDINGHTYSEYTGERLAINEFNAQHDRCKLDVIHDLSWFVDRRYQNRYFWSHLYWAHFFDHPLYNELDSHRKGVYTDAHGSGLRAKPHSNWRENIQPIQPPG